MVILRNLLVNKQTTNPHENKLKSMYINRIIKMFDKAILPKPIYNIFDEIFHGVIQTLNVDENLFNFYEAFLTITQYYQHSQAGRGTLAALLLKDLGQTEKMEFEFKLKNMVRLLDISENKFNSIVYKDITFDIINKNRNRIAFCELKLKVYSGCTAGRNELMNEFINLVLFIHKSHKFRELLSLAGIDELCLVAGVLFDIEGNPATVEKDKDFGICYSALIKKKQELLVELEKNNIPYEYLEKDSGAKAFSVNFKIDNIKIEVIAVYGNEVINKLFGGTQTQDISYFKNLLDKMLFDDVWLGQFVSISERTIANKYFRTTGKIRNLLALILKNSEILKLISTFRAHQNKQKLESLIEKIKTIIKKNDEDLLEFDLIPGKFLISCNLIDYGINDYIGDIVQFLFCDKIRKKFSNSKSKKTQTTLV